MKQEASTRKPGFTALAAIIALAILSVFVSCATGTIIQERLVRFSIPFSGYDWEVRQTPEREGPGENLFRAGSVWPLPDGSVDFRLSQGQDGAWQAAELLAYRRLGYGTYLFRIDSPLADLDPNLVLGLFTYSSRDTYHHREIDIEFSAWGSDASDALRGYFVVQPSTKADQLVEFPVERLTGPSSHMFTWTSDRVEFASWLGHGPKPSGGDPSMVAAWSFSDPKAVPKRGNEGVHMNLYLTPGTTAPAGTGRRTVTLKSFTFTPAR